ncbi:MAG: serine/threonine protein kinase [Puniceicoccaceae bacterium 5H]|nr:MAG: serine/threonine protein kinase [Puniceicoccaceae bacterium 5H]
MAEMSNLPYGSVITQELLKQGDQLGPYKIQDRLAIHLFGALYRVDKEQYGTVLIHVLPKAISDDPTFHKAYLGRCAKLNNLKDAHLLQIRDGDRFEERLVIEYEDVPGLLSLTDYFYEQRPDPGLDVSQLKTVMGRTVDAFRAVRGKMVGHFSLTPEMVMVGPKNDVYVYGFGLYESLQRRKFEVFLSSAIIPLLSDDERVHLTAMDTFSPEVRNDEDFDQRADIFSLGILTYFLLTGKKPTREWTLPSEARPELTEGWDLFVSRCLEPEPFNRFANFNAFGEDLQRAEKLHHVARAEQEKGETLQSLEALPLPKGLRDRYSRSTQNLIRLGLLVGGGAVVLGAAWFGLQTFTAGATQRGGNEMVVEKVKPGARGLDLALHIFPERASVRFSEQDQQFLTSDGELAFDLPKGSYVVEIESPRFHTQRRVIEIGGAPTELNLQLEPAYGALELTSVPGATVDAVLENGVALYLDQVPENGTLTLDSRLLAGEHVLRISRPGYEARQLEVTLNEREPIAIEAMIEPLPTPLQVLSEPAGLPVAVNGERRGVTPLTLKQLPVDEPLEVAIDHRSYKGAVREVTLKAGEPMVLDFGALEERRGELDLTVTVAGQKPTPAMLEELSIVTPEQTYTGQASLVADLGVGGQDIRVEHPDFEPLAETVEVEEAERKQVTLDLTPKPAQVRVQLDVDLPYALVVDGERRASEQGSGYQVPALRPLNLQLYVRNFQPVSTQVTIPPNKAFLWQPELKPLAGPERGEPWKVPYLDLTLNWIPAGTDTVGSPVDETQRRPADGPPTEFTLAEGFWISEYEVTQRLYQTLMKENPSIHRGANLPVDSVSWREAMQFCARLTELERRYKRLPEGYEYRLPTEMEWEYAARAGSDTPFFFGSRAVGGEQGNFRGEYPRDFRSFDSNSTPERSTEPEPVGSYVPNAWGLYDMHGNVSEWTLDGYIDRLPGEPVGDYTRAVTSFGRAVRGGSWQQTAEFARSASRDRAGETTSRSSLGFRVVLAPVMESLPVRK